MQHAPGPALPAKASDEGLPPAWREFIRFCRELRYGEVERLAIQDGLPVVAELTTKRVKFTPER